MSRVRGFTSWSDLVDREWVVTLLLGILIWAEWPASGRWVTGTFVAIDMVFRGTRLIMLALNARSLPSLGTQGRATVQPIPTFEGQPSRP